MSAKTATATKLSEKPQDRKEVILDAALELFIKQGYEGTSIDQIREASGFKSKASLYTHFKNKEEVSNALIASIFEKIQQVVIKADAATDRNALDRFKAVFQAYIQWGLTHREEFVFRIIRAQELRMLAGKYDFQAESSLHPTNLYLRFIDILESLRQQNYPVREIKNAALFHLTIGAICRAAIDIDSFCVCKGGKDLTNDAPGSNDINLQVEQILEVCMGIVFTRLPLN
jgi:AcrR family transcriptional regulator